MPRRLHRDQDVLVRSEELSQPRVSSCVLPERDRLAPRAAVLVDHRYYVLLRAHIDAYEPHPPLLRRDRPGASEPMPMLALVFARTLWSRDTVRASNIGRGRQSPPRGLPPRSEFTATLSRFPSAPSYRIRGSGRHTSESACARWR